MIYILNSFADKALEKVDFPNQAQINIIESNQFDLSNLNGKDQNEYLEDDEEEDAKYLFENQQYTVIDDDDDDEDTDSNLDLETGKPNGNTEYESTFGGPTNRLTNSAVKADLTNAMNQFKQLSKPIMKSSIDGEQWREEVEQMLPQLKLANRMLEEHGNNWRIRFDELKKRNNLINSELNQCNDGLGRLELDVQKCLDRLESRERYVQQQMDVLCNELLAYRSELNRSMENYQQINGGVISKSRRLAELNEQIQRVRAETEKREQSINDKTPLLQIKKALGKLRCEIDELNIRIGVAMRNVMYQNLQKTVQKNELHNSNYAQDAIGHLIGMTNTRS